MGDETVSTVEKIRRRAAAGFDPGKTPNSQRYQSILRTVNAAEAGRGATIRGLTEEVIVVIPTLAAGAPLVRAVRSLESQTYPAVRVVVVDNSAAGLARAALGDSAAQIVESETNLGFGEAINRGARHGASAYVAVMNDDAVAAPDALERMTAALDADEQAEEQIGMAAPSIRLSSAPDRLDSAGLNVYFDGVAKQRGHGRAAEDFQGEQEAFLPSGCAAVYRREMLDQIGWFDGDYFLYGEDTDVGLRARLAGWRCAYVPAAEVRHDYSGTAGRASGLKAYYVERNRLWNVAKNFPVGMWPGVLSHSMARYWAHWRAARSGKGLAGESDGALSLAWTVVRAHGGLAAALPALLAKRRAFSAKRRLSGREFRALFDRFPVTAREIAEQ